MGRKSKEQLRAEEHERLSGAIEINLRNVERDLSKYGSELGMLLYQNSKIIERINELTWRIPKLRQEKDCLETIEPEEFSEKYFDFFHFTKKDWEEGIEFSKELLSHEAVLSYIGEAYGINKMIAVHQFLNAGKVD